MKALINRIGSCLIIASLVASTIGFWISVFHPLFHPEIYVFTGWKALLAHVGGLCATLGILLFAVYCYLKEETPDTVSGVHDGE